MKFGSGILFSAAVHLTFIAALLFFAGRDAVLRVPERYVQLTLLNQEREAKAAPPGGGKAVPKAISAPLPGREASPPRVDVIHKSQPKATPPGKKKTAARVVPASVPSPGKELSVPKVSAPQVHEGITDRKKEPSVHAMKDSGLPNESGAPEGVISGYLRENPRGGSVGTNIAPALHDAASSSRSGSGEKDSSAGYGTAKMGENGDYSAISAIKTAIEKARRYPLYARQRGIEGTVTAEFSINSKGLPEDLRIKTSSGFDILDAAAKKTIIRAAPFPIVAGRIEIQIAFRLRQEE